MNVESAFYSIAKQIKERLGDSEGAPKGVRAHVPPPPCRTVPHTIHKLCRTWQQYNLSPPRLCLLRLGRTELRHPPVVARAPQSGGVGGIKLGKAGKKKSKKCC